MGESERRLREVFEAARADARSGRTVVVFLDEVRNKTNSIIYHHRLESSLFPSNDWLQHPLRNDNNHYQLEQLIASIKALFPNPPSPHPVLIL